MIKEIQIENFKSIQSLTIELGRVNVFIGANGSGKSNILEAIAVGKATIENKLDNEFLAARGIRVINDVYMPSSFEKDSEKPIIINFQNEEPTLVRIYKGGWDIQTDLSTLFGLTKETIHANNKIKSGKFSDSKAIQPFLIYAPENTYLRNFEEETQIKPLGIRGEGLFSHIVKIFKEKPELFQKINENLRLLDWFDGFEIPNDLMFTERRIKIKDRNLEDGLQYFDQRSANEGFLYLLFYLTLFISDETPKFFAIDNIDNAMNPKLGSELIKVLSKLAKEHDKQVIFTTHNPSVLDGLNLNDDDQRLFVIYRNADGHTKARRIMPKDAPNGVESVRLSEAFMRGYIGGLPKNF